MDPKPQFEHLNRIVQLFCLTRSKSLLPGIQLGFFCCCFFSFWLFFHTHHKCSLLLGSLEAPMAKFGSGVNELELDAFLGLARCVREQRL